MSGSILVIGAASQIGRWLLPKLTKENWQVIATTRRSLEVSQEQLGVKWLRVDHGIVDSVNRDLYSTPTVVSLMPVVNMVALLSAFALPEVRRLIVFSTSGVTRKKESPDSEERHLATQVLDAEASVKAWCEKRAIAWTIFRPTMIYGAGTDKNVSLIANFVRSYRFFPIVGEGRGYRQPVHAEDLAKACMQALANHQTYGKTYCLGGGEMLTYRTMVDRIFETLGLRPRVLRVPIGAIRGGLAVLRRFQRFAYLSPAMADRMSQDLVCDLTEAKKDFGYAPRPFRPSREELWPSPHYLN